MGQDDRRPGAEQGRWAEELLGRTAGKLEKVSERSAAKIPYTTVQGVHDDRTADIGWWTNGFWGGMMWQMYTLTGEESGLIPVDFRQPADVELLDSTAAAIAACGLIELSKLREGRQGKVYLDGALRLLHALEKHCLNLNETEDNLLEKCMAAYHDREHEFSIIYGDYYFLEALMKLNGKELFIW